MDPNGDTSPQGTVLVEAAEDSIMVVIVFGAFMLIADTVALIHQHHESQESTLQQKEQAEAPPA